MTREIQFIRTKEPNLIKVYGFGSFFRFHNPSDCDLLLVIKNDCSNLASIHSELSKYFHKIGKKLGVKFDLTILTEREDSRKPLMEHNKLIPLSKN